VNPKIAKTPIISITLPKGKLINVRAYPVPTPREKREKNIVLIINFQSSSKSFSFTENTNEKICLKSWILLKKHLTNCIPDHTSNHSSYPCIADNTGIKSEPFELK